MKKVLFIDRDGTLILEPEDFQIDSLEKLEFYPGVFRGLGKIARELDYELVMVSNQDGLGTASFPEADFWPSHHALLKALKNEGIVFSDILIDRSLPEDQAPTRKPETGMLNAYLYGKYDLANSFVIGDRATDVQLAKNLGCKSIYTGAVADVKADLSTNSWDAIYDYLKNGRYTAQVERKTKETDIRMVINLRGSGQAQIKTGLHFLDHMLDQIARHGNVDLEIKAKGDLEVDEHHTVEDVAIALGVAIDQALGDKRGIERYGFQLPMDDAYAQVALDLGGRAHFKWKAKFKREYVGDVPTELFPHFFESLCMAAKMNLRIQAQGKNEHHKIEAIFKGFARALKMAVREDERFVLPSTKGQL